MIATPLDLSLTFNALMAEGHLARTGHALDGYLVPTDEPGILRTVKVCCGETLPEPEREPFGVRWDGSDDVEMEPETDPWLQYPDGEVVDLRPHLANLASPEGCDCSGGFFAPTDNGPTEQGIERCDECGTFDGDFEAAVALAETIGGGVTIWYATPTATTKEV